MEDRHYIELRRTSPKPYPTLGAWSVENGYNGSSATRATIIKKGEEWYEVTVYNLRGAWRESSELHDNLRSFEEAKQWIRDYYGGKWVLN